MFIFLNLRAFPCYIGFRETIVDPLSPKYVKYKNFKFCMYEDVEVFVKIRL